MVTIPRNADFTVIATYSLGQNDENGYCYICNYTRIYVGTENHFVDTHAHLDRFIYYYCY